MLDRWKNRRRGSAPSRHWRPHHVPLGGWRDRARRHPSYRHLYRLGVFLTGLGCVAVGVAAWAMSVLLTIPPLFLGLKIWAAEFRWGQHLFARLKRRVRRLRARAEARPARAAVETVVCLVGTLTCTWMFSHFQLLSLAQAAVRR